MTQHKNLMTEGNIRRKMLGFALPILAGYFFQQLYNTVDALIVGNYLDADALAAVTPPWPWACSSASCCLRRGCC